MTVVGVHTQERTARQTVAIGSAYIWKRAACTPNLRARLAFLFISKLYRQMYASTGIATDSARRNRANRWARLLAKPCRRLFQANLMPELQVPDFKTASLPSQFTLEPEGGTFKVL